MKLSMSAFLISGTRLRVTACTTAVRKCCGSRYCSATKARALALSASGPLMVSVRPALEERQAGCQIRRHQLRVEGGCEDRRHLRVGVGQRYHRGVIHGVVAAGQL